MDDITADNTVDTQAKNEVPDGVWLDTRSADAVAWVAECAANYFASGPKADDGEESGFPDLLSSVRDAAELGLIEPTCALEAVSTALQAVCMSAGGALDEFFREFVGEHVVSVMRAEAAVKPVWVDHVAYPEFRSERDPSEVDVDEVSVDISIDAIHRVGAMVHNLRREPVAVVIEDGEPGLAEQWSLGAALNAALNGWEEVELSDKEIALLVALPLLAITELFEWMDREVIPGLSNSALMFLRSEMIRRLLARAENISKEAA
jgi:hypothetical protein